jgi:thiamine biosynthesis lipoprotein
MRRAALVGLMLLSSPLAGVETAQVDRPVLARVESSDEVMGTTFSIVLHGLDRTALESAARTALAEAARLDARLSNYKPDSEWSAMNERAGRAPFVASRELFELVSASLAYSRATDDAFDITVGPLMKAWGFFQDEGTLPAPAAVSDALALVGHRHVRLDAAARTVSFDRPGMELDPGGIAKGYAVDRMVEILGARGVTAGFVSAGGSSIYAIGAPPDEARGWPVAIRSPRDATRAEAVVFLRDASLSTSGSYEKFFRRDGRVYSHVMDPRTGSPASGVSAVSVVAPRTIDSEVWTKAYFVNGRDWASRHVERGARVFMCDDSEWPRCAWIE